MVKTDDLHSSCISRSRAEMPLSGNSLARTEPEMGAEQLCGPELLSLKVMDTGGLLEPSQADRGHSGGKAWTCMETDSVTRLSVRESYLPCGVPSGMDLLQREKKCLKKSHNLQKHFYRERCFWLFDKTQSPLGENIPVTG